MKSFQIINCTKTCLVCLSLLAEKNLEFLFKFFFSKSSKYMILKKYFLLKHFIGTAIDFKEEKNKDS